MWQPEIPGIVLSKMYCHCMLGDIIEPLVVNDIIFLGFWFKSDSCIPSKSTPVHQLSTMAKKAMKKAAAAAPAPKKAMKAMKAKKA